jgi:hypothetical protein
VKIGLVTFQLSIQSELTHAGGNDLSMSPRKREATFANQSSVDICRERGERGALCFASPQNFELLLDDARFPGLAGIIFPDSRTEDFSDNIFEVLLRIIASDTVEAEPGSAV